MCKTASIPSPRAPHHRGDAERYILRCGTQECRQILGEVVGDRVIIHHAKRAYIVRSVELIQCEKCGRSWRPSLPMPLPETVPALPVTVERYVPVQASPATPYERDDKTISTPH